MHIYTEFTVTSYDNIISKMKEANLPINKKSFTNFLADENLPNDIKEELQIYYNHLSNERIKISIIVFSVIIIIVSGIVFVSLYGKNQGLNDI